MGKLYDLAGDPTALLDGLVEQKEVFAREACLAALQDATGISQLSKAIPACPEDSQGQGVAGTYSYDAAGSKENRERSASS